VRNRLRPQESPVLALDREQRGHVEQAVDRDVHPDHARQHERAEQQPARAELPVAQEEQRDQQHDRPEQVAEQVAPVGERLSQLDQTAGPSGPYRAHNRAHRVASS
jgi:hypothetical protein